MGRLSAPLPSRPTAPGLPIETALAIDNDVRILAVVAPLSQASYSVLLRPRR